MNDLTIIACISIICATSAICCFIVNSRITNVERIKTAHQDFLRQANRAFNDLIRELNRLKTMYDKEYKDSKM